LRSKLTESVGVSRYSSTKTVGASGVLACENHGQGGARTVITLPHGKHREATRDQSLRSSWHITLRPDHGLHARGLLRHHDERDLVSQFTPSTPRLKR
jgi:hypothetical protein